MGKRRNILDTCILVENWRRMRAKQKKFVDEKEIDRWAKKLIRLEDSNAILSPIRLEIMGGIHNRKEYRQMERYLSHFRVIDEGIILPQDWSQAEQLHRLEIEKHGKALGPLDSLIKAIAHRLGHEVRSEDKGFH
jgi:hypothetical protein